MAVTLVEAAKQVSGDEYRSAVIEQFARSSPVLEVLPFETIAGNALKYNREDTLPGIGFRGVNESFNESTGVLNPQTESLYIAGGDMDVDSFITRTMGNGIRATHEAMKIKALALKWTQVFFKGDNSTEPRMFDGLQRRIAGTQLIAAGNTSGGDPLSLLKLDELIDAVMNPAAIFCNKTIARLLSAAARNPTVGGYVTYKTNTFGERIMAYNNIPILTIDEDNEGNQILPFNEANPNGGTAAATSIYCVGVGDGMLTGIQSGTMMVDRFDKLQDKPASRTRIEWDSGIAVFHKKAVARLWGVTNAAVAA